MTVHTHHQFYDLRFRDIFLYNSDYGLLFMNKWFLLEYIFMKMDIKNLKFILKIATLQRASSAH